MKVEPEAIQGDETISIGAQGPMLALVSMFVVAAVCFPGFRTLENLADIGRQVSMPGVVSIGMAFVILAGGIDLSVGSTVALAALLAAQLSGQFPLAPILVPIAVGVAIGALNGVLITRLKIQPFTATLAVMLGVRGLVFILAGEDKVVNGVRDGWFSQIDHGSILGIPFPVIIFASILCVAAVVSRYTGFGRSVLAVGGNEEAAGMMGLKVNRCKMYVYVLCGGCAGVGGVMFASQITSVKPYEAAGLELEAIAAVVISGISLVGGIGKVSHVVYGVLILGLMPKIVNQLPIPLPSYSTRLITGLLLLAVVLLQSRIAKRDPR